jgi:hypothetical protein
MKEEHLDRLDNLDKDAKHLYKDVQAPDHLRTRVLFKHNAVRQSKPHIPIRDFAKLICLFGIPATVVGASLWWRNANTLPPLNLPEVKMPNPNAHDTLIEAYKSFVGKYDPNLEKNKQPLVERQQLVAQNQKAYNLVRTALGQDFQQPMVYDFMKAWPESASYREVARRLAFAAQTEADAGNYKKSAEYAVNSIVMGIKISKGASFMGYLLGVLCENSGDASLWRIADKLDTKTLRETIQRLESIEGLRVPIVDSLIIEKYGVARAVQIISRHPDSMKGVIASDPNTHQFTSLYLAIIPKRFIYEASQKYMDDSIALFRKPYNHSEMLPKIPRDPINQLLSPDFTGIRLKDAEIKTQSSLLKTYLALQLHKLEKNVYPEHLDDLVKTGYLTKASVDAYGADRPLGYKRQGEKITLYSVGPDGKDDNGKPIDPNYTFIGVEPGQKKRLDKPRHHVEEDDTGDMVARINTY